LKKLLLFILCSLIASPLLAQETPASKAVISLDEKLGRIIPPGIEMLDEKGRPADLQTMFDRPTIIAPVYLGCVHVCPMLLTGLAEVVGKIDVLKPGKDFRLITFSFDDKDGPADAADKKKNYLKAVGRPFPQDAWTFLTGKESDIRKFTSSIGFTFQRDSGHDFSHPVTLVVVAPGGKIVRYIEGVSFLPFEVTMALTEASEGKVGSPARKALMYCFSYDPLSKSYVFNILKVTGTVMVLFVVGFFAYLMVTSKKKGSGKF
jgi:protein SCO1/2